MKVNHLLILQYTVIECFQKVLLREVVREIGGKISKKYCPRKTKIASRNRVFQSIRLFEKSILRNRNFMSLNDLREKTTVVDSMIMTTLKNMTFSFL